MNLLECTVNRLDAAGVAHALIGAAALALHGVSRATFDRDLLVTDPRVLDGRFWTSLADGAVVDVRPGDVDDPLAGVVRITAANERDVDLIVGRGGWQSRALDRAQPVGAGPLRVVTAADLVLLKLYAGGAQDLWDIEQLLAVVPRERLVAGVEASIAALPPASRELWRALHNRR